MTPDRIKSRGVHYTPPELAAFLAEVTAARAPRQPQLEVLDPACGAGILLEAIANAFPRRGRTKLHLTGLDLDDDSLNAARERLANCQADCVTLRQTNFLLPDADSTVPGESAQYDVVIANPPYVRTQVLGAARARDLARQFRLSGRVDLYQAFVAGMSQVLKPGGVLGLLTSNRFLTTQSGAAVRRLLRGEFHVEAVYDLGDTRLFSAAVLPVIVVAVKGDKSAGRHSCTFDRVYGSIADSPQTGRPRGRLLTVLRDRAVSGTIRTVEGSYTIERGTLRSAQTLDETWSLATAGSDEWLARVRAQQSATFGDLAHIRVGIKTTADEVFVRRDWQSLPREVQPEGELLHPLITHREAARWNLLPHSDGRRVLYPHRTVEGRRRAIDLASFPRAKAYLLSHADRLKRRRYLAEVSRAWYEIWVPHQPNQWALPKLIFPDIAESPRFAFDASGAIVQGDCYWATLKPGADPDWLWLMLAVANSTVATRFYDVVFHNKLYAGRRRYMTQYVRQFPLPALDSRAAKRIVALTRQIVEGELPVADAEIRLEQFVCEAFGVSPPDPSRSAGRTKAE